MGTYKQAGISYQTKPFEIDRTPYYNELMGNPGLLRHFATLTNAEVGRGAYGDEAQSDFVQTAFNRAAKEGKTLNQLLKFDTNPFTKGDYYEPRRPRSRSKWNASAKTMNEDKSERESVIGNIGRGLRGNSMRTNNASTRDFAGKIALGLSQTGIPMDDGGGDLVGKYNTKTFNNSEYYYNKRGDRDFMRMGSTVVNAPQRNPMRDAPLETVAYNGSLATSDLLERAPTAPGQVGDQEVKAEFGDVPVQDRNIVDDRGDAVYHGEGGGRQNVYPLEGSPIGAANIRGRIHTDWRTKPPAGASAPRTPVEAPSAPASPSRVRAPLPTRKPVKAPLNALQGGLPSWADEAFGNVWGE